MRTKSLITERALAFMTHKAGGTTGVTYNGVALASTVTGDMVPGVGISGKAINMTKFTRALVVVSYGTIGESEAGTITAKAGKAGIEADAVGNTLADLTGFSIAYTNASSNTVAVGEIDATAMAGNGLWIVHDGDGATVTINVIPMDASEEPVTGQTVATVFPADIG